MPDNERVWQLAGAARNKCVMYLLWNIPSRNGGWWHGPVVLSLN